MKHGLPIEDVSLINVTFIPDLNQSAYIGKELDYILVKKELKDEFLKSMLMKCIIPMLKETGQLIYY